MLQVFQRIIYKSSLIFGFTYISSSNTNHATKISQLIYKKSKVYKIYICTKLTKFTLGMSWCTLGMSCHYTTFITFVSR